MGTVLDYLKEYGDYSLEELPFSDVDSLILSQFSYLKFDDMVPGLDEPGKQLSLKELEQHAQKDKLFADERYRENNTALYEGMLASIRFGGLKLSNYVNKIDLDKETQFSAVTCVFPDGTSYVAFRGTDETIVGWKEDLNLAFSEPVPGQIMSVDYLEKTAATLQGRFCVGGHSKGGNLAVYSAMYCNPETRARITWVFNHDGPGFRPEVLTQGAFQEVENRIRKTIPHSSLVGMILFSEVPYRVVESKKIGVAQHDPYTWLIDKESFRLADEVYSGRKVMDESLNEWILSLTPEQMRVFVDTLYQILLASETDNLIDLAANWPQSVQKIRAALKQVDEETAKTITKIIKSFMERISVNTRSFLKNKAEQEKEKLEEGLKQLEQKTKKTMEKIE